MSARYTITIHDAGDAQVEVDAWSKVDPFDAERPAVILGIDNAIRVLDAWVAHSPTRRAYTFGEGERGGGSIILAWWGPSIENPDTMQVQMMAWDAFGYGNENEWAVDDSPMSLEFQRKD